jgi:xanthine dehydrogenase small subunit
VRLLVDRQIVDVDVDTLDGGAATTLLEVLREGLGRTGTKEGCASGDCGACTVLASRAPVTPDETPAYRSVNACIAPAGAFAGHHVITVEGLAETTPAAAGAPAPLHPAQQAMIDAHGSQCGFCTPGFVMSLAGLLEHRGADAAPERAAILEAISGNLCRCTGYRPIVDAATAMFAAAPAAPLADAVPAGTDLADARPDAPFFRPTDEASLQALLREHPDARLVAGGTDLMLEYTQGHGDLGTLVDVSNVAELRRLEVRAGDARGILHVGAAVPLRDLEHAAADHLPPLAALLTRYGSPQIRHRGTLGGSLGTASPIGDLSPVLQVLDAELELGRADGSRRRLPVTDFHLDYRRSALEADEYIVEARLPLPASGERLFVRKFSKRHEDDISSVLGAALTGPEGLRFAWGGMAATPRRSPALEALLAAKDAPTDDAIDAAIAADVTPMDDVRASAAYRRAIARAFVREVLQTLDRGTAP